MFPSGVSKNSKDQFIKAQKEAKAQREKAKLQHNSAIKIQACFRGSRARQAVLKELTMDPSKKISDVLKLKDKIPVHQLPLISNKFLQYKGLLSFVIFIKPSNAKSYTNLILGLSELVLSSLEADDAIFLNILNRDREIALLWYVRLKHILLGSLEIAYDQNKNKMIEEEGQIQKIAEKLFEKTLNIKQSLWSNLEAGLTKNPNLDISFRKNIKEKIIKSISSSVIQNMIHSWQLKESSFLRKFVLKVSAERSDIENGEMFIRLLGLQGFYEDFGKINLVKRQRLLHSMTEQINIQILNKRNDHEFLSRFFNEIVEFFSYLVSNNLLQGFQAPFFMRLFEIYTNHLESYSSALLIAPENKKIISNTMEVEEEEKAQLKEVTPQQKKEYLKEILEKNPKLSILSTLEGVKHFCQVICSIISLFTSADFDIFSNLVAKGCSVFLLFKRVLNSSDKMQYKNTLSFELNFYYIPFICIKRQGYNVKSMVFVPEKYVPIIRVFSECLYQTLRITDDEEFLNNNEITVSKFPLNQEDLVEIAKFTNYVLFNVLWNRVAAFYSVTSSQVKLVRELKARDIRLKYCPKDFWIIPELVKVSEQMLSDPDQLKVEAHSDILEKAPHMLTFETRLKILAKLIETDKGKWDRFPAFDPEYDIDDDDGVHPDRDPKVVSIHRQFILEDGFDKILKRKDMRSIFMIRFINEHGMAEEGIDGGGLLKEFITLISKIAFDANYGLFHENEDKTLMPCSTSFTNPDHLKLFNFIGRLTGKAIYEHILLENVFSVIFLNRILKIPNTMNELKFADPTLYKNLMLLKHKNDVADKLHLTFSVDEIRFGESVTIPLKPGGDKIEVTEANKLEYISLFCNYKLNLQIDAQSKAFLQGLKSCIDLSWIKLFDQRELQFLISGERRKGFDVFDLQSNVEILGFTRDDITIKYLWEVLNEMNDDERSLFLHFITGCSRPPTLGFKSINPKIAIHNASQGKIGNSYLEDLPTSSTCANLFKLPDYRNKDLLRAKILYAINSNAGFDLG